MLDSSQDCIKNVRENKKISRKVLVIPENVVPLHPLNKQECSLKDLHRQIEVVQEAST